MDAGGALVELTEAPLSLCGLPRLPLQPRMVTRGVYHTREVGWSKDYPTMMVSYAGDRFVSK